MTKYFTPPKIKFKIFVPRSTFNASNTKQFLQSSRPSCNPTVPTTTFNQINLQQSISSKIHTQLNVSPKRVVIGHKLRYSSNGLDSSVKKKCIHDSLYDKNRKVLKI